jgi:hypothetical protein
MKSRHSHSQKTDYEHCFSLNKMVRKFGIWNELYSTNGLVYKALEFAGLNDEFRSFSDLLFSFTHIGQ